MLIDWLGMKKLTITFVYKFVRITYSVLHGWFWLLPIVNFVIFLTILLEFFWRVTSVLNVVATARTGEWHAANCWTAGHMWARLMLVQLTIDCMAVDMLTGQIRSLVQGSWAVSFTTFSYLICSYCRSSIF